MKNKLNRVKGKFLVSMLAGSILLAFSACSKEEVEDIVPQTEEIIEEELTAEEMQEEEPVEEEPIAAEEEEGHKEPKVIPEDLLAYLEEAWFAEDREEKIKEIAAYPVEGYLSVEEAEAFLNSPDLASPEFIERYGEGLLHSPGGTSLLRVDGDNDGIEDIYLHVWDGGSSGIQDRFFFQGQEDGTFVYTSHSGTMAWKSAFVEWEGRNYLLEPNYDYTFESYDGLTVICYQDGRIVEEVFLQVEAKEYKTDVIIYDENYKSLAEQWQEKGQDIFSQWGEYEWRPTVGSAEVKKEAPEGVRSVGLDCAVDLDNDGKEEWLDKHIWYGTSLSGYTPQVSGRFIKEDEPQKELSLFNDYDLEHEGKPRLICVEHAEETGKQIVCIMHYDGITANYMYGYLLEGESVSTVFEIKYEGNLEIIRKVYDGEDIHDDIEK